MPRYKRFTFLLNQSERAEIAKLAERLSRSQSDAVRFVVLEAARQMAEQAIQADAIKPHGGAQSAIPACVKGD